jgi:uncharacterized protein
MRRFLPAVAFLAIAYAGSAFAALQFPALTGRVVDDAHILSINTQQYLDGILAAHEARTTNQIVVVTLPSLQNTSIEDFGYQLGRHWGIGQKGKDNGALLIVAPTERKVRIEVGYGLEGTLTDAKSSQIVQTIVLPYFRKGEMETGITEGTRAILSMLGDSSDPPNFQNAYIYAAQKTSPGDIAALVLILTVLFILFVMSFFNNIRGNSGGFGGFGTSSGGGFGGGFSGGGGGFGGGGASGGW